MSVVAVSTITITAKGAFLLRNVSHVSAIEANLPPKLFDVETGYWDTEYSKKIHNVKIAYCDFTYDPYKVAYGTQEILFVFSDLEYYKQNGYCTYEMETYKTLLSI